ncbi:MAG: hypothetical protein NTZ98_11990 [Acidobacteria bacterium]|nr:hypothetical protein [Acidobacteriota bacterium]
MNWKIGVVLYLLCGLAAGDPSAGPGGLASIGRLAATADLIAVGDLKSGFQTGGRAVFSLELDRVLKGSQTPGSGIQVEWKTHGNLGTSALPPARGLWFVKQAGTSWELLSVTTGEVPFSDTYLPLPAGPVGNIFAYAPSDPLGDKLASELANAAVGLDIPDLGFRILGSLDQLTSPVVSKAYQQLSEASAAGRRALGFAGLIRKGDLAALAAVSQQFPEMSLVPEFSAVVSAVDGFFRSTDPAAVALLGQFATNGALPRPLAYAAAHALRSIHTKEALPYLATLLDAPENELRYEAIGGMAAFANNLPVQRPDNVANLEYLRVQSPGPFTTEDTRAHLALGRQALEHDEARYLNYWRAWWARNKSLLVR